MESIFALSSNDKLWPFQHIRWLIIVLPMTLKEKSYSKRRREVGV
jgi:hypothetical protein